MAIYDLGTASLAANGEVTGVGTTWKAPLTLIRVGATIVFKTEPVQIYTISEIISDTQVNVYNPNSETVPVGTGYAILAHDGITVQGLAQYVAETLRYYQSRETEVSAAVDIFKDFDQEKFSNDVSQVNTQFGEVVTIAAQVSSDASQVASDKDAAASSAASASADKDAAATSAQEAADYAASLNTQNILRKDLNFSDVADKALARENLGFTSSSGASYIGTSSGGNVQSFIDDANSVSINILDYLPQANKDALTDLNASMALGSVNQYIESALADATSADIGKGSIINFPAGFFFLDTTLKLPRKTRIRGVYPDTYFICLPSFSGTPVIEGSLGPAILSLDNDGQDPYEISGFQINAPTGASNFVGIHIGGSRNSTLKDISVTGCYDSGILIYPKNASSGDIENFTLDHCWTIGGGIRIINNPSIARGNITDGKISNCMIFAGLDGQSYQASNPAIVFTSRNGKQIYGVRVERCYTMTIRQSHIYLDNYGGIMSNNTFCDISGESQLNDGTLTQLVGQPAVYIKGATNSKFMDIYRNGVWDLGYVLDNCHDNAFDGLYFPELLHVGVDNTWLYMNSSCYNNRFTNIYYDRAFDVDYHSSPVSVTKYFSRKINDEGSNTFDTTCITSNPVVSYGRDYLFSVTGSNLTNFPQTGIIFVKQPTGVLSTVFPAGSSTLTMNIPVNNLQDSKQIFALLKHQFTSTAPTAVIKMGFDGRLVEIGPQDLSAPYYAAVSRMRSKGVSNFQIQVSGSNRNADVIIDIYDLVISGNGMAYPYNACKIQGVY